MSIKYFKIELTEAELVEMIMDRFGLSNDIGYIPSKEIGVLTLEFQKKPEVRVEELNPCTKHI